MVGGTQHVTPSRPNGVAVLPRDDRTVDQMPSKSEVGPRWFSMDEVAKHNTITDGWIVVDGNVFNISNFASRHPGWHNGAQTSTVLAIKRNLGKECSNEYKTIHSLDARAMLMDYYIGKIIPGGGKRPTKALEGYPSNMKKKLDMAFNRAKKSRRKDSLMGKLQDRLKAQHKRRGFKEIQQKKLCSSTKQGSYSVQEGGSNSMQGRCDDSVCQPDRTTSFIPSAMKCTEVLCITVFALYWFAFDLFPHCFKYPS
mmetsp:Transcript_9220/g.22651  ORF Transcript_9220/g.22651 Transcript_9220/m.22651 type:complete len:254 (+) Transcript_9220:34-795(+)